MNEVRSNRRRARRAPVQQLLFQTHGGARRGAGRKPKGARAMVSHAKRARLLARFPVLVTMKVADGRPGLRRQETCEVLRKGLRDASERNGMRVVHFSIQANHVHAIVEARDEVALSRGMTGLCVRVARGLNRVWKRVGRVWADRFHARVLHSPREVRHAIAYVLLNATKHAVRAGGVDPWSSGDEFDGWKEGVRARSGLGLAVGRARGWLLRVGWRRWGLISIWEVPGGAGGWR